MNNKYAIRRALLKAMVRFVCPQDLNTILCDDAVILLQADHARIQREWDELTAAEYIMPVQGFPEYRSLAPVIRAKLTAGETMLDDPFLSGASAIGR